MTHINRLRSTEIQDNQTIFAADLNAEFDQLVTESNQQNDRITTVEATTIGINTTVALDNITEFTSQHGTRVTNLALPSSALTISSGLISITNNNHIIDTEGAAASDDLTTISARTDGYLLTIRTANSARDVVVKHNANNIWLKDQADMTLGDTHDSLTLMYSTSLSLWIQYAGGAPTVSVPTGTVAMWCLAYTSPPTGWFVCNGGTISRTTYATLFALIGTTFGSGDGSTTFNLPDFRGRIPLGKDDGANRVTSASTGGSNANTLGGVGGAETHTLTAAQLASHSHDMYSGPSSQSTKNSITQQLRTTAMQAVEMSGGGSDQPHSNTQPWLVINFIIKY